MTDMNTPDWAIEEIPQAAKERACELADKAALSMVGELAAATPESVSRNYFLTAFARHIATVSDRLKEAFDQGAFGHEISTGHKHWRQQFADLMLSEPVDPLLVEAREMCAQYYEQLVPKTHWADTTRTGHNDELAEVQIALAALRRGIELGEAK